MPDPEPKKNKSSVKKKLIGKTTKYDIGKSKKKKPIPKDEIAKSKQLVQKLQNSKSMSSIGSKSRTKNNNDEVRLCGNGKPMPSLAELEKMFEDSDSDGEIEKKSEIIPKPSSSPTPITPPTEKLTSPKTIEKIADRILDIVSQLTEPPVLLDDDEPPPRVIKPKKRKKTGIPYIVGCKERPFVPYRPNVSFCKGDEDYGVEGGESDDDDDDIPKKRAKYTKRINLSKSIFNAASDDIAARLKENDEANSDASIDSNKTVAYEYYTPCTNKPRSFSPLPSTSRDNATFVKNDQLFNESLVGENETSADNADDIEIIETPCETIVINDNPSTNQSAILDPQVIDLIDDNSNGPLDSKNNIERITKPCDDDSIQIIDVKPPSPIPVDDYYSYYDLSTEPLGDDDVCEVIYVDDVIAENAAIIKKYSKRDELNTVTEVDVTIATVPDENTMTSAVTPENNNVVSNETIPVTPSIDTTSTSANNATSTSANAAPKQSSCKCDGSDDRVNYIKKILKKYPYLKKFKSLLCTMPDDLFIKAIKDLQTVYERNIRRLCGRHPEVEDVLPSPDSPDIPETRSKKLGDCPICMDTLSNKAVASTMCGHIFCMDCIKLSIKANGKKCPTCRKTLRGTGFHQIFL